MACTDCLVLCTRLSAQIKEVMLNLPQKHQTLLFSATMPREIEALAGAYLNKPVTVKVSNSVWLLACCILTMRLKWTARTGSKHVPLWVVWALGCSRFWVCVSCVQVGAVSTPTANVAQTLEHCPEPSKLELLCALLGEYKACRVHAAMHGRPLVSGQTQDMSYSSQKAVCPWVVLRLLLLCGMLSVGLGCCDQACCTHVSAYKAGCIWVCLDVCLRVSALYR